mgnify:CR=1 FL=1
MIRSKPYLAERLDSFASLFALCKSSNVYHIFILFRKFCPPLAHLTWLILKATILSLV